MTVIAAQDAPSPDVARGAFNSLTLIAILGGALIAILVGGVYLWRWQLAPPEAVVTIPWPTPSPSPAAEGKPSFQPKNGRSLQPAPDPRVIEPHSSGLLPKIAEDGTRPFDLYARPMAPVAGVLADAPRIAILLTGAGIGQLTTVEAMVKLPTNVSFALSPYSSDLVRQAADIRNEGHEVMLDLPIRDPDGPPGSAGPSALSDSVDVDENHQQLFWAMARFQGYFGVSGQFKGRLSDNGSVRAVLSEVQNRGLGVIDYAADDLTLLLDQDFQPQAIDEALQYLEQKANKRGMAIGVAATTPLLIDRLRNWSAGLASRGYRLVPVSALLHGDG